MNRLQQQEPNQLIQQWQNELSQRGYIENEGGILNLFQKMDLQKEGSFDCLTIINNGCFIYFKKR